MSKLAIACELSFNEWLDSFPEVIPEAECSKKHEKWKRKLFNKMRDDHYHLFTTKTVKVILVAAILSALLLTAFVIPSSRKFILDNMDYFSVYQLTEHNNNSINGEIKVGYIPEGFVIDECIDFGKQIVIKYYNSNGDFFTIDKYSSSIKVEFNTENNISEEIYIDDIKYIYCESDSGIINILWTENDYIYQVETSLNKEELLEIVKNIE